MIINSFITTSTKTKLSTNLLLWKRYFPFSGNRIQSDIIYNDLIRIYYYCCGRTLDAAEYIHGDIVPRDFSDRFRVVKGRESDFPLSLQSKIDNPILIPSPFKILVNVSNCDYYKVKVGNVVDTTATPDKNIYLKYETDKRYILLYNINFTVTIFTNAPAKPIIKIQLIPSENSDVKIYSYPDETQENYRESFHIIPSVEVN